LAKGNLAWDKLFSLICSAQERSQEKKEQKDEKLTVFAAWPGQELCRRSARTNQLALRRTALKLVLKLYL